MCPSNIHQQMLLYSNLMFMNIIRINFAYYCLITIPSSCMYQCNTMKQSYYQVNNWVSLHVIDGILITCVPCNLGNLVTNLESCCLSLSKILISYICGLQSWASCKSWLENLAFLVKSCPIFSRIFQWVKRPCL